MSRVEAWAVGRDSPAPESVKNVSKPAPWDTKRTEGSVWPRLGVKSRGPRPYARRKDAACAAPPTAAPCAGAAPDGAPKAVCGAGVTAGAGAREGGEGARAGGHRAS